MHKLNSLIILAAILLLIGCNKKDQKVNSIDVNNYFQKINSKSITNQEKVKYVDTLYTSCIDNTNDSVNRTILFDVVREYFKLDQNETYLKTSKKLYQLALSEKDTLHLAKSLCFIGDYYENETKIDSAFKYYSKSEKLYKKIKDSLNIGRLKLYKAGILYDGGSYTESEAETAEALKYLIKTNHERLIYEAYNLMALNTKELNNFQASIKYFDLALNQLNKMQKNNYPENKIVQSKVAILNNKGGVYVKTKNFKEAIYLYGKGLETKDLKKENPKLYAMLLDNLAYAKMKSGSKSDVEKLFLESLYIRDSLQITAGIIASKINIGEYYLHKKDTLTGLKNIKEGYKLATEVGSSYDIKNALKLLSENDKINSNLFTERYIKVNDSLVNSERQTRNKFARIAFETDQIQQQNEFLSKKNKNILIVSIITMTFMIVVFIAFRLNSKNRELILKQKQQKSNEKIYQLMLDQKQQSEKIKNEERNRIAMELHDGIVNRIFTSRFNLMQLQSEQTSKKEELINELVNLETEIRKVSHELQQIIALNDNSYQETLIDLIRNQQNEFNTHFDISIDKYIDWSVISSEKKFNIYRIIQEALQNVNKYSKAEKCFVLILKSAEKISIRIWDDGVGFDYNKIKMGIGLKNIKQRTESLNGNLKIISNDKGTSIEVIF
jgi:signal transduction histidine kinase